MGRGRPRHRDLVLYAPQPCPLTQYVSSLLLEHWNGDDWQIVLEYYPTRDREYDSVVEHVQYIREVGLGVTRVLHQLREPMGEVILGWEGHEESIHPHTWVTLVVALHCPSFESDPIGDELCLMSLMVLVAYLPYMSPELTLALKLWLGRVVASRPEDPYEQEFIPHVQQFVDAAAIIACAREPGLRSTLGRLVIPKANALDSVLDDSDSWIDRRAAGFWRDGILRLRASVELDPA